jgi:hypothetical protein
MNTTLDTGHAVSGGARAAFAAPAAGAAALSLSDDERQRCEIWTRVMGYHRPVSSFNTGKKGEFNERQYFEERRCADSLTTWR